MDLVSDDGWLSYRDSCLLTLVSDGGRDKGTFWDVFYKSSTLHDLFAAKELCLLIPSPWELGFQNEFWESTNIQSIAV
jgi:hypothetical protein